MNGEAMCLRVISLHFHSRLRNFVLQSLSTYLARRLLRPVLSSALELPLAHLFLRIQQEVLSIRGLLTEHRVRPERERCLHEVN